MYSLSTAGSVVIEHQKTDAPPMAEHFKTMLRTMEDMAVMFIDTAYHHDFNVPKVREGR